VGWFLGSNKQASYLEELTEEERQRAVDWIIEQHADAELLAALYYSAYLSRAEDWQDRRFTLRDWLRNFTLAKPIQLSAESLRRAQRILSTLIPYKMPQPTDIASELGALLTYETRTSFARTLETELNLGHGGCTFERVEVARPGRSGGAKVECMALKGEVHLKTADEGLRLISRWSSVESLDYYRVATPDNGGIIFIDLNTGTGYWRRDREDEGLDLVRPEIPALPWQDVVDSFMALAAEAESELPSQEVSA